MHRQIRSKKTKKRTTVLLSVAVLILAALLALYLLVIRDDTVSNSPPTDGINYNPPTNEEKAAGDLIKDSVDEEDARQNNSGEDTDNDKKTVSVIITDASQYDNKVEVRSFIPNHFHDGTCIIKFTKLNYELTKKTPAYRDVSSTICTNPDISRSEFQENGDWKVEVKYESEDAEGVSETQTVTIN